ncbi:hypothetical protein [Arthrobacter sp. ISL-95]|uniref:hypothetical protein n=1 Tax=Arthrobacter sp. ISL-95 TaxID=2819116 RepID=UPI001BEA9622|nr:hypothetical protein [Arthrobacter sp. ISL-95]MBT2587902.1 hypothetical protein [Arthrobacter sp. ISL-95]
MMGHDLIRFPGAFISMTSIHGFADEIVDGDHTGNVYVDYGQGNRILFEGSAEDVMGFIDQWIDQQPSH